jgi:hypothetical protein
MGHPKLALGFDGMLIVAPDHGRVFREAGWSKARFRAALEAQLMLPADEMLVGVGGIEEGLPARLAGQRVPKFRDGGLVIAYTGGGAGLFSAVVDGWAGGSRGSIPVTREVAL